MIGVPPNPNPTLADYLAEIDCSLGRGAKALEDINRTLQDIDGALGALSRMVDALHGIEIAVDQWRRSQ